MHPATKFFFIALLTLLGGTALFAAGSPAQTLNPPGPGNYTIDDDEDPEITARVARISFISGAARLRREGIEEWENVTLNLPLVAGDEIATDGASKIEIQFGKDQHLRLWENAYLKIVSLKDDNIAVSLSLGTLSLRITSFTKDRQAFEIDAPKTTIAIQRAGAYRVDAGRQGDSEILVSAREGGEARIYSDSLGFTLKNGRSSRIFIDGQKVGEWEAGDASRYTDDFDEWAADRDLIIAKRLSDAYYDKYYDNDIYGADDLNDNGQWVYISGYGTVWQPYSSAVSSYSDWSPYRYGHWRWMRPYGWIWVNDEPWGWATYHHGRWFHHNARWYWSPYGHYRPRRSWWFPALVVINVFNNNTCWYPLSYRHRWRNYNHRNNGNYNGGPRNLGGTPTPIVRDPRDLSARKELPLDDEVPPIGVVLVPTDQFGTKTRPTRPPIDVAKTILAKKDDGNGIGLPAYKDVRPKIVRDIATERPPVVDNLNGVKTGAGIRKDSPLDGELRNKTVFGGRPPRVDPVTSGGTNDVRKQGAIDRPPVDQNGGVRYVPPAEVKERPTRPPVRQEPVTTERPKEPTPRYIPPPVKERPVEKPRSDPPPVRPTRTEPPPAKSEPKPVERKAPPPPTKDDSGKKDKP